MSRSMKEVIMDIDVEFHTQDKTTDGWDLNAYASFSAEELRKAGYIHKSEIRFPEEKVPLIESEYPELGKLKFSMTNYDRGIGFNQALSETKKLNGLSDETQRP